MSIENAQQMSRGEKLKLMELLWEQLSRPDDAFESPVWHGQALNQTKQRLAEGKEQVLDWEVAKKELRRCFEWRCASSLRRSTIYRKLMPPQRRGIFVETRIKQISNTIGAAYSRDVAPTELKNHFGVRFYKDFAPTLLACGLTKSAFTCAARS